MMLGQFFARYMCVVMTSGFMLSTWASVKRGNGSC